MSFTRRAPADTLVTVFGGSGFVGRHVVRALAKRSYRIRVACRRPDLAGHLQPLGNVGQIHAVQANLRYRPSIDHALEGTDAVVNLVGILQEGGRQTFDVVQAYGPRAIAEAAAKRGIARMVQVSALGAGPDAESVYARTKAQGEQAVSALLPDAMIVRPSLMFGPEDSLFNRFAELARLLPVLPIVGGTSRFQPVFVGDVAEAIARGVDGNVAPGIYELGGPEIRTLRELVEFVVTTTHRRRPVVDLPVPLARMQAGIMEFINGVSFGLLPEAFRLTGDQVRLLQHDNVVSEAASSQGRTLEGLGIAPTGYEAIVPTYLWRYRKAGQFDQVETPPQNV